MTLFATEPTKLGTHCTFSTKWSMNHLKYEASHRKDCPSLMFFFWDRPILNHFNFFSGFAEITLAKSTWPWNKALVSKMAFVGLILRLNCLSLLNSSSVQSSISSVAGAKMQMSSRYSRRVTNCWSLTHYSIKWQKLESTKQRSNSLHANS